MTGIDQPGVAGTAARLAYCPDIQKGTPPSSECTAWQNPSRKQQNNAARNLCHFTGIVAVPIPIPIIS
jgi:hypothetical protein